MDDRLPILECFRLVSPSPVQRKCVACDIFRANAAVVVGHEEGKHGTTTTTHLCASCLQGLAHAINKVLT